MKRHLPSNNRTSHCRYYSDIPGEYITHPRWRMAFLACAEEAGTILVVIPASERTSLFPGDVLSVAPTARLVGVVSKIDAPEADISAALHELSQLGIAGPVFATAISRPETIAPLRAWLDLTLERGNG